MVIGISSGAVLLSVVGFIYLMIRNVEKGRPQLYHYNPNYVDNCSENSSGIGMNKDFDGSSLGSDEQLIAEHQKRILSVDSLTDITELEDYRL